jgi:hypothetical protein
LTPAPEDDDRGALYDDLLPHLLAQHRDGLLFSILPGTLAEGTRAGLLAEVAR